MEKYFTVSYAIKRLRRGKRIKRLNISQYSCVFFNSRNWQEYMEGGK